jgi:hypothetical protein
LPVSLSTKASQQNFQLIINNQSNERSYFMMNIDSNVIKQMIEDLNHSIALHTDSIENIHGDCYCIENQNEIKCYHCRLEELINDLDCLKANLEPISMNTLHHVRLIDAEAFRYAMEHSGMIHSISCYPIFNDPNSELNYPEVKADSFAIDVKTSRFAMDGNGSHVGYEMVIYQWKAIRKADLNIYGGIPKLLSNWVIDPDNYEIIEKDLPEENKPIHDDDCEFDQDDQTFDQCDCAEMFNGYSHPDDDFFYQNIQAIIDQLKYPEAEFNANEREWTLGDCSFNLNQFESDSNYAEDVKYNDGAPFVC